jgi:hypothetical protein
MPDLTIVNLRTEAAAEATRLANARAVHREGDDRALTQLQGEPAWIASSGRSARRRLPGQRVFLIWRVAIEDEAGHRVESRLVAMAIEIAHPPPRARRREWILTLLGRTEDEALTRVNAAAADWREAATKSAGAFAAARLTREHAIARRPLSTNLIPSQPGLFDRRTERDQLTQAAAIAANEQAIADRLRTVSALATLAQQPPQLLLVLVP